MKKPKLYLYLSVAVLVFSFLTWFVGIIGLGVAITMLILVRNEIKNATLELTNYSFEEIKYLKTAKVLAILSLIISAVIVCYQLFVLVIVSLGFFGY